MPQNFRQTAVASLHSHAHTSRFRLHDLIACLLPVPWGSTVGCAIGCIASYTADAIWPLVGVRV